MKMKVAIGSDHKGYRLKEHIKAILQEMSLEYRDVGTFSEERVDYTDFAAAVAMTVAQNECDCGIAICATGIGASITANKVPGIRAALCHDTYLARMSRQHNNANVLCLGALDVGIGHAEDIVRTWLTTAYEGGRHQRRVDKIAQLERACAELLKTKQ
ncbi:MAG: ribose 5-phosphate isomerase B [Anaerolineae bacterium]